MFADDTHLREVTERQATCRMGYKLTFDLYDQNTVSDNILKNTIESEGCHVVTVKKG